MFLAAALIQLILLVGLLYIYLKKQGPIILIDNIKIMFILWITTLILYDFRLSSYYNPTVVINLIVIFIWLSFLVLSKFIKLKEEDLHSLFKGFMDKTLYKRYFTVSNIIAAVGIIVFVYNAFKYGLAITERNKIDKQRLDHYAGYIVYMLVLAAEIKYILYRNHQKLVDLLVFAACIVVLFLTLNRGPIAFLIITFGLYELINFVNISERLTKKAKYITYGSFAAAIILFIWFFGYIGNMRMDYVLRKVYKTTLWNFYGVSEWIPSGLLWLYIYLTSPLENAAYSIANQGINFTYFNNLFYPFIKFFANIIGQGEAYKNWLTTRQTYVPYLYEKIGLNAPSFIAEAIADLDLFGLAVYVTAYMGLAYLSIRIIKESVKLSSTCKMLIYTNITSILLWSVFVNSFRIPILLLNILLLLAIEIDYKLGVSRRVIDRVMVFGRKLGKRGK